MFIQGGISQDCVNNTGEITPEVSLLRSKESACQDIRDADLIPESGRSSGGGDGKPPQYSCLENPMDRRAWQAAFHKVAQSWTRLKGLSTHSVC